MNALELDGIRRAFGGVVAVDDVSIDVRRGEFVTLLGPSGSGKTSTLRLIGGFEQPDAGAIRINGSRVDHLPAYQRDTTTIFQTGALFPHKTVAENVAYGLRMRGVSKADISSRVRQALDVVRLSGYEERYPAQLSGGQKQRVALARSMVVRPAILLFDEPLSALDLSLRLQLRAEIKRLHDEIGFSAIYVTHDQGEAMAMSSRVAVMRSGRIEQIDRPEKVFGEPSSEFVYTFIGESCCLRAQVSAGTAADSDGTPLDLRLSTPLSEGSWRLYVRPSRLYLGRTDMQNGLRARLDFTEFLGDVHRYHFKAGKLELFADHPGAIAHRPGDFVDIGWQTVDMMVYQ
ncbi:ABC transporter ATP-binding protein [Pararhizobium capsulatum]|nr:ABC transporter ATP-binding protein [Pararhizobium capsulatum]